MRCVKPFGYNLGDEAGVKWRRVGRDYPLPCRSGRPWAEQSKYLSVTQIHSHLGMWCWVSLFREPELHSQGRIKQKKHLTCPANPMLVCSPTMRPKCGKKKKSAVCITPAIQFFWLVVKNTPKQTNKQKPKYSKTNINPHHYHHIYMQNSSSSYLFLLHMHTCLQITHVNFYPHTLVYQVLLARRAQGYACTVRAITMFRCVELAWFIALRSVSSLHFGFISLERPIPSVP